MRILCAKCRKPVDEIRVWHEPCQEQRIIQAFCHGERDEMSLSLFDLARLDRDAIRQLEHGEGVAFMPTPEPAIEQCRVLALASAAD